MRAVALTSNKYMHCLPPFAYLWNKHFGLPVVVACYDELPGALPDNFEVVSIGAQADYTWSAGVLKLLDLLPDEKFILVLEDYFLSAPVDVTAIARLTEIIHARSDVAKIDLSDDRLKVAHTTYGSYDGVGLIRSADDAAWQMSVQAAILRKEFLRAYLDPAENAWQAERLGTKRVIAARQRGEERRVILGATQPPMQYVNAIGGEGSMPGTWALHRFPAALLDDVKGLMQWEL